MKKTRIGSSLGIPMSSDATYCGACRLTAFRAGRATPSVLVLLLAFGTGTGWSRGAKDGKQTYGGIVAGTVFRNPGFAVPGARVTLTESLQPGDASSWMKKPLKTECNERGEFAFRVPAIEMHYTVSATAKGLATSQKKAEVRGEERVDVTFLLDPESKK